MLWPEKNSCKEFVNNKKIPAAGKFPSPSPHNFSNGPSLNMSNVSFRAGEGEGGMGLIHHRGNYEN